MTPRKIPKIFRENSPNMNKFLKTVLIYTVLI